MVGSLAVVAITERGKEIETFQNSLRAMKHDLIRPVQRLPDWPALQSPNALPCESLGMSAAKQCPDNPEQNASTLC